MLFSIVIPTYNRANLLPTAIRSVLNQTFTDWELIIVDDGSTDNTAEVIQTFTDERIRYVYQENAERSAARNKGIALACGEWICFLDSDDEFLPHHLQTLIDFISNNNVLPGLYLTGHLIQQGQSTRKHPLIDSNSDNILREIWTKFILMNTVCVHHTIIKSNLFVPEYRIWEDTHLWLRIAAQFPVFQIPEYTCLQHVHEESTVVQGLRKVKIKQVEQYIHAISDLEANYPQVAKYLSPADFQSYKDAKYRMYLYQARQNKQLGTAIQISCMAFRNRPSMYLLMELPKILLNKMGLGLHAN